jgi:hypothetical protein
MNIDVSTVFKKNGDSFSRYENGRTIDNITTVEQIKKLILSK